MAGDDNINTVVDFGDDSGADEVVVTLPTETGGAQITKVAKTPDKAADADAGDPVADLKSQFATMTQQQAAVVRENETLRQQATQATQRVAQLEHQVVGSQLDTVVTGLEAAKAEADSAERDYAVAFEAGDGAAMARAQRRIASSEARILTLSGAKDELEEAAKRTPTPREQPLQRPPQPSGDPVEDFTRGMSQKSAAWIRAHPECVTDPKQNARMLAAHNLAFADGIKVDTPEYFQRIEDGIRASAVTKKADVPQPGRRPAAPAAGGAGAGGGALNGGTTVTLTKGEAMSATDGTLVWNWDDPNGKFKKGDPIGLEEMARRKHFGKKQGLYDKSLTE